MVISREREIYQEAAKCFELLTKSIRTFEDYLSSAAAQNAPEYYQARNFLKDGKLFFDATLSEARRLLGPIPAYAAPEYEQRRAQFLEENKIVARAQDYEELRQELKADENLKPFLSDEEIDILLHTYYETQKSGKRKLSNIKIRILAAKLHSVLARALDLQREALKKHQP